ncbi:MAG: winged helix-turn-helix transcriptional regulator [Nanoarchaeota archaeon]|nr:winged helix-turn-helix transcriptional regulator [Nanoarchaeota archaeon]
MDNFVVLSMTDEGKDVAKVLSNETAIKILNKLAEKRMCPSEIAKELNLPLSTVQYNLELLKKVNLIRDTAYRYSEKGKKVLYYEPAKKVIILAPKKEKESILSVLKDKFLIPIVLIASLGVGFAAQRLFGSTKQAYFAMAPLAEKAAAVSSTTTLQITTQIPPWLIFFFGSLFAVVALAVFYFLKSRGGSSE